MTRLALIGARGHTGAELVRLIDGHPHLDLVLASSRANAGQAVADHVVGYSGDLVFENVAPDDLARANCDAVVLALPNDYSRPFADALTDEVIVDLSADHRFDEAWHYGLPEVTRGQASGKRRIANPGCYATAMQLVLHPIADALDGPPVCFGVSGYSGAGTTPSDRNNPDKLRDNIMPYAPFDHVHEREVSRHLGHRVRFLPHVASFFRGIIMTVHATVAEGTDASKLIAGAYGNEPLVTFTDAAPWVADCVGKPGAYVGGVAQRGCEVTAYATLDNLLKGAATQALQNLNLACGYEETEGLCID